MFRAFAPVAFLRMGWQTVQRDRGAIPAVVLLSLLFFLAQLLVIGSTGIAGVERLVRAAGDIAVEVLPSAPEASVAKLKTALEKLPAVERVAVITREQALERARLRDPNLEEFLTTFHLENPYPDTISVRLANADAYASFIRFLQDPAWSDVVDPAALGLATHQEQELRDLLAVTRGAGALAAFALGLVILSVGCAVAAFVWRRAIDTEELALPNLLGVPIKNVLLPFAAEHTVLLLASLAVGTAAAIALLPLLPVILPALGEGGALALVRQETMHLLALRLPLATLFFAIVCPLLALLGVLPAVPDPRRSRV